jgi:phage terminase large subunit-like protein
VFDAYIRAVVEKGNLIFPEDFCFERTTPEDENKKSLEEISSVLGPYLYAGNYFNNPVADDLVEFKSEWFHIYKHEEVKEKLRTAKCIISVDPATKIKQSNDPSGIVVTKVDQEGFVYVILAKAKKLLPNQLCDEIFNLVDIYQPDIVTFEMVSSEILWEPLFNQEMRIRNKHFRFEKHEPGTGDSKGTKIRKLIPYYARGQVYHCPGLVDLEKQLREFPRNSNDDIIDALQAQIPYWKGTTVVQTNKLTKYTQAWWDELRARNQSGSNSPEQKLFEEYRTPRPSITREPKW